MDRRHPNQYRKNSNSNSNSNSNEGEEEENPSMIVVEESKTGGGGGGTSCTVTGDDRRDSSSSGSPPPPSSSTSPFLPSSNKIPASNSRCCVLTTMLDDSILLNILSFLSTEDLGCHVRSTNKFFAALALRNDLWKSKLEQFEKCLAYPNQHGHDRIQARIRHDPDYLPDISDTIELTIPSRMHGAEIAIGGGYGAISFDSRGVLRSANRADTFFPHPDDHIASRHPHSLLLSNNVLFDFSRNGGKFLPTRFCQETSELQDMFVVDNPTNRTVETLFSGRSPIYLKRQFPIECTECGCVTLDSVRAVVEHCATHTHYHNSARTDERLVSEHLDPRLEVVQNGYSSLNNFSKCRLHAEYRSRVVAAIRSVSLDDRGRIATERFTEVVRRVVEEMGRRGMFGGTDELAVSISKCTVENILREFMEFAGKSFLRDGMTRDTQWILIGRADVRYSFYVQEIVRSVSGIDPERLRRTD